MPLSNMDKLLQLPAEYFGSPSEWLPFNGVSRLVSTSVCDEKRINWGVAPDSDDDEEFFTVPEIGHVADLREYLAKDIDRKPDLLSNWIDDLADGRPLGDGHYETEFPHNQPHGIPGHHCKTKKQKRILK